MRYSSSNDKYGYEESNYDKYKAHLDEEKIKRSAEVEKAIQEQGKAAIMKYEEKSLQVTSEKKKIAKYAGTALAVGAAAVFAYSPGLLALRLSDASIVRATLSIMVGLFLVGVFGYATYKFFAPEKKHIKTINSSIDVTELSNKLKEHTSDAYIGKLASQALTQIDRLNRSIKRVEFEIANKFESSSMTYQNFYASVDDAGNCAFKNLASFLNRIQLYNHEDYNSLKNYKDDDIPDEIQEKQIELMQKNFELAKDALTANENLILGLESLAIEIADANFNEDSDKNQVMLDEINKLTNTIKYYI